MNRIAIKPLSINDAFYGKHRKTQECRAFEEELWYLLPAKVKIPEGKLQVHYIFGLSNRGADVFNQEKILTDVLCKKYGWNDNRIYEGIVQKHITKKGEEFVAFEISAWGT